MKYIFLFFVSLSVLGGSPSTEYTVFYIPMDVDFFTPAGLKEIGARSEAQKKLSLPSIDKLFKSLGKCKLKQNLPLDLRIKIERPDGVSLYIDTDRKLNTESHLCDFEKKSVESVISEIEADFKGHTTWPPKKL